MEAAEIEQLVSRSDDELYGEIGTFLLPGRQRQLSPADLRRAIDVGRTWAENTMSEMQDAVCLDPRVVAARQLADTDPTALFLVVLDVLAAREGWPPPATVTALLMKMGLDRLCADR